MIRYFLAEGDRGGSATITEGLPTVTCSNPPPRVHIATLGMKTYCTACGKNGFIAPKGPRWPGTGPNGKPWALSGDVNVCGCNPPPVFYAERGMKMIFTTEQAAALTEPIRNHPESAFAANDEQYVLCDERSGRPLVHVQYRIYTTSGRVFSGVTDFEGNTQRVATRGAEKLRLEIMENHDNAL
ncbi:PAAR domain-containing protein [Burkholderia sola]|uniref:PAAR domain-containing protein n=1 Tax=Burkholderia sola TaxID=2843302 RepID=UPI00338FD6C8